MALLLLPIFLTACGTLEKKASLISYGDTKERVVEIMGTPGDRSFNRAREAWQYGKTGAGFGYHDYRVVWFEDGRVIGVTSYRDYTPASSAQANFRPIRWESAPDRVIEIRDR